MKLEDFKKLLDMAQTDESGNLFVYDKDYKKALEIESMFLSSESNQKHYFGFIYTVCDDLIAGYCGSDENKNYELYDRHFTSSDDTLEAQIVRR